MKTVREVGDIVATTATLTIVVNWLTLASVLFSTIVGILTIGWWIIRYYEKLTHKQFSDLKWIKKIFRT